MLSIEIRGAKEAQQAFEKAGEKMPRALDDALYSFAQELRAYLKAKGYPGKRSYKMIFFSDRQRRFIHAMVRMHGGIGYRRSGNLANAFSVQGGSMNYRIFNSRSYASFVIGDGTQAYMHAGNWWTISSAAEPKQAEIGQFVEDKIAPILP